MNRRSRRRRRRSLARDITGDAATFRRRLIRPRDIQLLPRIDKIWVGDLRVGCSEGVEGDAVVLGDFP